MSHPSPNELREWKRRLEQGQATPGMIDRVIEGYEALWKIRQRAEQVARYDEEDGYVILLMESEDEIEDACDALNELSMALAPFAELEPEQEVSE